MRRSIPLTGLPAKLQETRFSREVFLKRRWYRSKVESDEYTTLVGYHVVNAIE